MQSELRGAHKHSCSESERHILIKGTRMQHSTSTVIVKFSIFTFEKHESGSIKENSSSDFEVKSHLYKSYTFNI